MLNREIYTDVLGREGIRWQIGEDRYAFMPVSLNSDDRQVDVISEAGNSVSSLHLYENGSVGFIGYHMPHPYVVWINTDDNKLSTTMFGMALDPRIHESVFTAGFIMQRENLIDFVKPIALTYAGHILDVKNIHSIQFESDEKNDIYGLRQTNSPGSPHFVLRKLPLDWEFGIQFLGLFHANITTAVSNITTTADLLRNGVKTTEDAEHMGKLLTFIQKDVYLPAK